MAKTQTRRESTPRQTSWPRRLATVQSTEIAAMKSILSKTRLRDQLRVGTSRRPARNPSETGSDCRVVDSEGTEGTTIMGSRWIMLRQN